MYELTTAAVHKWQYTGKTKLKHSRYAYTLVDGMYY